MAVSVETLSGLERKVRISVPAEKINKEVESRIKNLAAKVKIDGFRPGKVPMNVVKQRYSHSVLQEVAREMIEPTLYEALVETDLVPAGTPFVEPEEIIPGNDFNYSATFEVFPKFDVNELDGAEVEVCSAKVTDEDVEKTINNLREQNKVWEEVSRDKVKDSDKVMIDFEGFLDDTPFEGGKGENYEVLLGSGSMIAGFEDGIIGATKDKEFDINVTFPENYGHAELAGKPAKFKITVKKIMEGSLPELDDAFAEKFNIKEGGVEALKKDIRQNMERELDRRLSALNREAIFDEWMKKNTIDLPKSLIDQEIEHLKHDMYHRVFGHEHKENEQIPDFPRELFEEQARRRVQLGLIFSEYVKKHAMKADKERVDAMIETFATAYETPEEVRAWYRGSKERMAELESLVMEEMVSEKVLESAKTVEKLMNYDDVINPKKSKE